MCVLLRGTPVVVTQKTELNKPRMLERRARPLGKDLLFHVRRSRDANPNRPVPARLWAPVVSAVIGNASPTACLQYGSRRRKRVDPTVLSYALRGDGLI